MTRFLSSGFLVLFSLGGLAACDPGEASENLDAAKCMSSVSVTGTFVLGAEASTYPDYPVAPDPLPSPNSCWPVGKWTFTTAKKSNPPASAPGEVVPPECLSPSFETSYEMTVDRLKEDIATGTKSKSYEGADDVKLTSKPSARFRGKISQGGLGSCSGSFDIYSEDGKTVTVFSVGLNGTTLVGEGTQTVFEYDQYKQ